MYLLLFNFSGLMSYGVQGDPVTVSIVWTHETKTLIQVSFGLWKVGLEAAIL